MKRNRYNATGFSALLLAGALATASTVCAEFAIAKSTAPIAANGIGPHKGGIPVNGGDKQMRRASVWACTAPGKSPFPCQRRR